MNNTIISNEGIMDTIRGYAKKISDFVEGLVDEGKRDAINLKAVLEKNIDWRNLEKNKTIPKDKIEIKGLNEAVFSDKEVVSWKELTEQLNNAIALTDVYKGDLVTLLKNVKNAKDKARPFNEFSLKLTNPKKFYLGSGFIYGVTPEGKIEFNKEKHNKAKYLELPKDTKEFSDFMRQVLLTTGTQATMEFHDAFTDKKVQDYINDAFSLYSYSWKEGEVEPGGYSMGLMDMAAGGVYKVINTICDVKRNYLHHAAKIAVAIDKYLKNNISTEDYDMSDTIALSFDKIQGDLNFKFKELNSALSDNSALKTLCKDIRCSLESGDGIDTDAAKVLEAVVANIYDRNGIPKKHHPNFVSLEGINDGFDRINLAKSFLVSLEEEQQKQEGSTEENKTEGEGEKKDDKKSEPGIITKIYNTICELLGKVKDMIFNGLGKIAANAKKLRADIEASKDKLDPNTSFKWEKENFEAKENQTVEEYTNGTSAISKISQLIEGVKSKTDKLVKLFKEAIDKKEPIKMDTEGGSFPVLKSINISNMDEALKVLDDKTGLEKLAEDFKKQQEGPQKEFFELLKKVKGVITNSSLDENKKKELLESVKKENTYVNNYFKAIVTLLGDVLKGCSKWFEEAKKKKSESK